MYELMRTMPGRTLRYLRMGKRYAVMMIPGMLVMLAVYFCLYRPRMERLDRRDLVSDGKRELVLALFLMYCGGMATLTLLPLEYADVLGILRRGLPAEPFFHVGKVSVAPLAKMFNNGFTFLANIVMFMPFGFCPALLWRSGRWYRALGVALLITENIECWQLFIGRTFDVDDLILNILGAMLGWLLWLALKRPKLWCREREPVENIIAAVVAGERMENHGK